MSNCNTLTCQIDGRVKVREGTLTGREDRDCTGRGRSRSDRRTAEPAPTPQRQPAPTPQQRQPAPTPQQRQPAPTPQRQPVGIVPKPAPTPQQRQPVGIVPKPAPTPTQQRQPAPTPQQRQPAPTPQQRQPVGIVPKREPTPSLTLLDRVPEGVQRLTGGADGTAQTFMPKPTDLGGGSTDAPMPLTHVEGVIVGGPTKADPASEGMIVGEAQRAAGVKAAGALDPQACYRRFLALPPTEQARILTAGVLARYQLTQGAARDVLNGAYHSATIAANWIFNSFSASSPEVATFCNGVATFSPAGALAAFEHGLYARPRSGVVSMMAQQAPDGWTAAGAQAYADYHRRFFPSSPLAQVRPAGVLALIDGPTAMQLFGLLPPERQVAILRGTAFAGLAYPAMLASALERGGLFVDGVPVPDLFESFMGRYAQDDPRWALFRLAVQDAQTNPAGYLFRAAGNVPGGGGGATSGTAPTIPSTRPGATDPARTIPSTRPGATAPAPGSTPAAPPSNFLSAAGLTADQWAALADRSPDVAAQLWREFNNRPNTFAQVSTTILQAATTFLTGLHQQNVDDLAATNASYAHQQSMANIALQREQAEAQRALAQAQASQPVVTYQPQVTQAPAPQPPQPPPSEGITAKQLVVGGVVLAALGSGAYYLTRRKRNRRAPRRSYALARA